VTQFRDTDRAQFEIFKSLPRDTPIEMLNLVQFLDDAAYPKDHPLAGKGLTGAQAYGNYGAETAAILEKVGGKIIWRANFEVSLIGDPSERWDAMFIARYETSGDFFAMITDPDYQRAVVHRQAAVANSRLIRTNPQDAQGRFG